MPPQIRDPRLTGPNVGNGEPMLPAVSKVIGVFDNGPAWLQDVTQAHVASKATRRAAPVLVHRAYCVADPTDRQSAALRLFGSGEFSVE